MFSANSRSQVEILVAALADLTNLKFVKSNPIFVIALIFEDDRTDLLNYALSTVCPLICDLEPGIKTWRAIKLHLQFWKIKPHASIWYPSWIDLY